jgi:hypothetical protein
VSRSSAEAEYHAVEYSRERTRYIYVAYVVYT